MKWLFQTRLARLIPVFILGAIFLFCPAARADDGWTLTDVTLVPQPVTSITINADTVTAVRPGGSFTLGLDKFVAATRGQATPVALGKLVLHTRDGQRFVGLPVSSTDGTITWSTATLGDRTLPLASVAAIDRVLDAPPADVLREDVVTLANHDSVRGVLSAIDSDTITVTVGDAPTPIALANVAALHLATTAAPKATSPRFIVGLIDGTVIQCSAVSAEASRWTLTVGDNKIPLTADQVVRVEYPGGPVRWLSAMPAHVVYTPYLTESFPPVMDASVTGGPIRAGGRQYDRGIGVHAKTVLTFDLDGTRKSFRTRYAAEPSLPLVDAIVRIKVDGKTIHEHRVRGEDLSPVIWADLSGAKTLTLEVDFGPGHATQDRINWIEPALLTTPVPPASQPTTQTRE